MLEKASYEKSFIVSIEKCIYFLSNVILKSYNISNNITYQLTYPANPKYNASAMYMGNAILNGFFISIFIKKCKFQRTLANASTIIFYFHLGYGIIEEFYRNFNRDLSHIYHPNWYHTSQWYHAKRLPNFYRFS